MKYLRFTSTPVALISRLFFIVTLMLTHSSVSIGHSLEGIDVLQQSSQQISQIIEQTKPGVVYIEVLRSTPKNKGTQHTPTSFYNDPDIQNFFSDSPTPPPLSEKKPQETLGHGSGFIISSDGYIVTNSHVIKNAKLITVTLKTREQYNGKIIGIDKRSDIGVIKIDTADLPVLPLGSSELLTAGEPVLAFGSPFAYIQTVTSGIISATGRNSLGISDYEDFIQTDAAINPGNSGGPLVNIYGEVIGVNTAFITGDNGYMGIGFAVPMDMTYKVARQLIKQGEVTRGWLGVALKDADPAHLKKQRLPPSKRAARIVEIEKNSPAAKSNLAPEDLIVSINNVTISGAADLRNQVSLSEPGSEVTIGYYRNGKLNKISVRLGTLE